MCSETNEYTTCGFICHFCGEYFSIYKKNIIYHVTKKKKCISKTKYSYDESFTLSQSKTFHFDKSLFDTIKSYVDIVEYYTEKHNYVEEDYEEVIEQYKMISSNAMNNIENKKAEEKIKEEEINEKVDEYDSDKEEDSGKEDNSDDEEDSDDEEYKSSQNNPSRNKIKYNIFLNKDNDYECPICHYTFKSLKSVKKHMTNIERCEKRKQKSTILNYYKNTLDNRIKEASTQTTTPYVEKSYSEMCIGTDDIEEVAIQNQELEVKTEHVHKYFENKPCDYNKKKCEDAREYVYMIQMAANAIKQDNIVKIGMTKNNDPMQRMRQYEKGYKVIQIAMVKDATKVEKELLAYFRQHFTQCNHLGKELFQGSIYTMLNAFKILT